MSAHQDLATPERLSAYLDGELSDEEARELERHLEAFPEGQRRLAGMRRVVEDLRRLEPRLPPPTLHGAVRHRVALERERRRLLDRLEDQLGIFTRQSPLLVMFAVILALALFIYFFAVGVERSRRGDVEVVVVPAGDAEDLPDSGPRHVIGSRLELAGRVLFWDGGRWHQRGVDGRAARTIVLGDAEGAAWLAAHPGFEPLLARREAALVEVGGEVLLLEPAADPGGKLRPR